MSTYATFPTTNLYGMAFDSAGFLYVADATQPSLYKVAPGGGSMSNFGTLSANGVIGLAFDSSGNLYGANPFSDRVDKIAPNGATSIFASIVGNPRFIAIQSVPEPSSMVLLAVAGVASCIARRRRRASA